MKYKELVENHKPISVSNDLDFLKPFLPYNFHNAEFLDEEQEKIKINMYFETRDRWDKWSEKVFVVTFMETPVMICYGNFRYSDPERKSIHVFDLKLYDEMIQFLKSLIKLEMPEDVIMQDIDLDIEGLDTFFKN